MKHLLYTYTLHKDLDATYTNGSTIAVYYDDVNSDPNDILVTVNNVVQTSGPSLGVNDTFEKSYTVESTGYQYCDGLTLRSYNTLAFNPPYPYAFPVAEENHYSCAAQSCDIALSGPISVTKATDDTTADGEITISAISSYTVKYTLNSDPKYSTAQASGTFTGLNRGIYNVTAIDEYGCKVTQKVTVGTVAESYGVIYRLQYKDKKNNSVRDEILKKGYTGAVTDIKGAAQATTLEWPSSLDILDKYIPIRPGKMTINAISETDFQFVDTFTQDDRELRIRRQKDTGTGYSTVWEGYIIPSIYTEPYVTTPYISSLTGTDGLRILKDQLFIDNDGFKVYGTLKIIKIIAFILKKLDLDLNIRVAANIYEAGHNKLATDDPLDQSYLDVESFIDDGEPLDCEEVLSRVLKPFGAFITQVDGYWWIIRYEELIASFDYREFTVDGVYTANGTYNPIKEVKTATDTSRLVMAFQDQIMEKVPAYGTFSVFSKLTGKGSLIRGDFSKDFLIDRNDNSSGFKYWSFIFNGTEGASVIRREHNGKSLLVIRADEKISAKPYIGHNTIIEYGPGDKIRFSFEFGFNQISDKVDNIAVDYQIKIGTKYLTSSKTWSTTAQNVRQWARPSNGMSTHQIVANSPSAGGQDVVTETLSVTLYYSNVYGTDYGSVTSDGLTNFKEAVTHGEPVGKKATVTRYDGSIALIHVYELKQSVVISGGTIGYEPPPAQDDPNIIHPNDLQDDPLQANYNPSYWSLTQTLEASGNNAVIGNTEYMLHEPDFDILPNGQEPLEEELTFTPNNPQIKERFETDLHVVDLPTGKAYINNSPQIYNNWLRLSNGTRTKAWTRDGVNESNTLQQIYSKSIAAQYLAPSQRISGSYHSDIEIKPIDCLKITQQGTPKFFLIAGLKDVDVRNNTYNIDAIELKDAISGGFPVTRAHSSGHNSGHS